MSLMQAACSKQASKQESKQESESKKALKYIDENVRDRVRKSAGIFRVVILRINMLAVVIHPLVRPARLCQL